MCLPSLSVKCYLWMVQYTPSIYPKTAHFYQKPLMPPQQQYLHAKIDEMLVAGVIEQCEPGQVKCVSPMMLAQKAH
ncbi:hypothetical protein L208DRAFT_1473940, partial [Tricholoma matsutake]